MVTDFDSGPGVSQTADPLDTPLAQRTTQEQTAPRQLRLPIATVGRVELVICVLDFRFGLDRLGFPKFQTMKQQNQTAQNQSR